jgi:hypothetical protein
MRSLATAWTAARRAQRPRRSVGEAAEHRIEQRRDDAAGELVFEREFNFAASARAA